MDKCFGFHSEYILYDHPFTCAFHSSKRLVFVLDSHIRHEICIQKFIFHFGVICCRRRMEKRRGKKNLPLARQKNFCLFIYAFRRFVLFAHWKIFTQNTVTVTKAACICYEAMVCVYEPKTHRFSNEMKENDTVLFALERLL